MRNILALTDYSTLSELAVNAAFKLAKQYEAGLTIYHNSIKGDLIEFREKEEILIKNIDQSTEKSVTNLAVWKSLAKEHEIQPTILIGSGKIQKNIAIIVQKYAIDMIVMGSSGAGGKKEYLWGSNTQRVVENVDCPVLVIKKEMADYRLDNIVFASSFNIEDKEVFTYFLDLIKPPKDATIHLLTIDTISFFNQPSSLMKEVFKDYEKLALPYKTETHFYPGYSVDAGIRKFLKEVQPDILVMSNRVNKPIKHALQGNETLRAVNHSEFPVLTIDYK